MCLINKGLLFGAESICMFFIYSIIPFVLEISSAAFLNVNLLTADFYSVLVGIFMKQYKVISLSQLLEKFIVLEWMKIFIFQIDKLNLKYLIYYFFLFQYIYLVALFIFCWTGVDRHRNNYVQCQQA